MIEAKNRKKTLMDTIYSIEMFFKPKNFNLNKFSDDYIINEYIRYFNTVNEDLLDGAGYGRVPDWFKTDIDQWAIFEQEIVNRGYKPLSINEHTINPIIQKFQSIENIKYHGKKYKEIIDAKIEIAKNK